MAFHNSEQAQLLIDERILPGPVGNHELWGF